MHSIAEVQTQAAMLYYRFDESSEKDVEDMAEILGELADQGMVYDLSFHPEQ